MIQKSAQQNQSYLVLQTLILAAVYFVTAWFGLKLNAVNVFATLIWAPTGISLAALLLLGESAWPGIALGAFLVNWAVGAPALVALGISAGNTFEALMGACLLRKAGFQRSFEKLRDVLAFVFLGAAVSTLVSASFGVAALAIGGKLPIAAMGTTWRTWWLGDVMGNLTVCPLLLIWSSSSFIPKTLYRILEVLGISLALSAVSCAIFTDWIFKGDTTAPGAYFMFPVAMIIALRFGPRGVSLANFVIATLALWATAIGHGRFGSDSLTGSFFLVQMFLAVLFASGLILAAIATDNYNLYRRAQKAIVSRDEFLSIASHELKTPLTALSLQLEVFRRKLLKNFSDNDDLVALANSSGHQIQKLSKLLNDLLDLTRIRSGQLTLEREKVNLSSIVSDVVERFKAEAAIEGIELFVKIEGSVEGNWDRLRLEQVCNNLISNAFKYGNKKPVAVSIQFNVNRTNARLVVQDQGTGIAEHLHQFIFERFERGVSDNQKISGLGLGLYICRQIVDAHGGTIKVDSQIGQGSSFVVDLPRNL